MFTFYLGDIFGSRDDQITHIIYISHHNSQYNNIIYKALSAVRRVKYFFFFLTDHTNETARGQKDYLDTIQKIDFLFKCGEHMHRTIG